MSASNHIRTVAVAIAALLAVADLLAAVGQQADRRVVVQGPGPAMPPRDPLPRPAESQPTGAAVVEGVVVSADLGRPVRRATVRLAPVVPGPPQTTLADDMGRFRFEGVPAGQFLLTASKPGYLDSTFGQRQPGSGRPGTPLSVSASQRIDRLSLAIARGGVLAGTVSDDGGEPAFGTDVQAYRFVWQQGERTLRLAGSDTADDRGSFRIGALPPGEYLVMASPAGKSGVFDDIGLLNARLGDARAMSVARVAGSVNAAAGATPPADYTPVFYPGTTSSASAMHVTIGVSEVRSGLDVQLPLVAMTRVEGVVLDAAGPAPGTEVRLVDLDMPIQGLGLKSTMSGPDGRFAFENVPAGRYRVQARTGPVTRMVVDDAGGNERVMVQFQAARVGGPGRGGPGFAFAGVPPAAPEVRWATAEVVLSGAPHDPITLVLQQGLRLSGRVLFDGPDQPPADLSSFSVALANAHPSGGASSAFGQVGDDGRFTIEGVTPGVYRVTVMPGSSWRPKSFIVGGRDALDFLLTVTPSQEIGAAELTLTTRTSTLSGTLTDGTGRPAPAHTIVVFPDDRSYWVAGSRRVRATRPSTDGKFSVSGLPAGSYRLVAVDDLEDGQWFDPKVLEQLAGAALPLSVGEGENKVQDLRLSGR